MSTTHAASPNREPQTAQVNASLCSEVVFIDPGVSDIQSLLAGMRPEVEPIVLDTNSPALVQIATKLCRRSALDAVHIIAHGAPGEVSFSAGRLSIENIDDYVDDLSEIGRALGDRGDLRLWCCRTGAGGSGRAFLGEISRVAAANVAATTGLVGAKALGGSWSLDGDFGTESAEAPLTAVAKRSYRGLMVNTATWGGGSGNWSDANWSGGSGSGGAPGAGDNVVIGYTSSGSTIITADTTISIASLTLTGRSNGSKEVTLTVTSTATVTVGAEGITTNADAHINGTGTLIVNGGAISGGGSITASSGLLDITGTGSIVSGGATLAIGTTGTSGAPCILELNLSGGVAAAALTFTSGDYQTLEIGPSGNVTLTGAQTVSSNNTIQLAGGTLTDSSGLTIGSGATLTGSGTVAANIAAGSGTITASGGVLNLTGTVASGNAFTIATGSASTLEFSNTATAATAISISNANQTLQIGSGGSLTISAAESITNGKINMAGGTLTDASNLTIGSGATLTGSGTVAANIASGTGTITASGGTLNLTGTVASGNAFTIASASASTLEFSNTAAAAAAIAISNANQTLKIGSGGSLTIGAAESITNGTINMAGGTLTDSSGLTIGSGATLSGSGSVSASVDGAGTITASGGTLTVTGTVNATTASTINIAAGATLKFDSTVGGTVTPVVTFQSNTGVLDLTSTTLGNFHAHVAGFQTGDNILVTGAASASLNGTANTLTVYNASSGVIGTITLNGTYTGDSFTASGGDIKETICFMPGTRVATPSGEIAVEMLNIGDLVMTADGHSAPVRWIGRQAVSRLFADPLRVLPIRIQAGALGENLPARDLLVSGDHAILLDGVLVQAGALVNGSSVRRDSDVPMNFTYYHVELDDHALVLAEGVPAETFIDNVQRQAFDNWDEHEALYPDGRVMQELPYARVMGRRQVPHHIRERLAQRAAALFGGRVATAA